MIDSDSRLRPTPMDITVDLVPPTGQPTGREPVADHGRVALVVDVLRSATAASVLLDRGVASLSLTASLRTARRVAARDGALLVGERDGVPPEGFNVGNSPAALRRASVAGRPAVLLAAESPRALVHGTQRGPTALVGLTNALRVSETVLALEPSHVDIVCAGLGGAPDLSDVLAAGLLVSLITRGAPRSGDRWVTLHGAAHFCVNVLRMTADPLDGLWLSASGALLRATGLEEDLAIASAVGSTDTVPWVTRVEDEDGRPVVHLDSTPPS